MTDAVVVTIVVVTIVVRSLVGDGPARGSSVRCVVFFSLELLYFCRRQLFRAGQQQRLAGLLACFLPFFPYCVLFFSSRRTGELSDRLSNWLACSCCFFRSFVYFSCTSFARSNNGRRQKETERESELEQIRFRNDETRSASAAANVVARFPPSAPEIRLQISNGSHPEVVSRSWFRSFATIGDNASRM